MSKSLIFDTEHGLFPRYDDALLSVDHWRRPHLWICLFSRWYYGELKKYNEYVQIPDDAMYEGA